MDTYIRHQIVLQVQVKINPLWWMDLAHVVELEEEVI
jgi:hypothetical protein